ncbi:Oxoglutarate/iron-dependent dioxygenase [Sesbania bispinosa]|nr:Oxoglutarate/iron-dependent dioxygenase [Sesbania bispinosa]
MLPSSRLITLPLTSSFHLPLLISLNRCLFLHFSSKFSPMGKTNNDSAKASRAEPSPRGGNSAVHQDPVMPDSPLSETFGDNKEYIMIGTNRVQLTKTPKNSSFPSSTRCKLSSGKPPELMSGSDHLHSSPTVTTFSEHGKFKRRTRVDLGLTQASGDNCSDSSFSSSFEKSSMSLNKTLSTRSLTSHHCESPQHSHFWKKKAASANTPYNSHNNSNYAKSGHKIDSSVDMPKFNKQFDICFRRKRNSPLIGATLSEEKYKESCIEMQEGGTKDGVLRPGMVLLKHFMTHDEQVKMVRICRELGLGPGGFYQPGYADGAKLRLKMMCLGMDWDPQTRKYGNKRVIDGIKPPSIPPYFSKLVTRAIQEAHYLINEEYETSYVEDILPSMTPDICIVNFYSTNGRLGLHQDRDESRESLRKGLPVVSFSIGDSAEFLYGDQRDVEEAECVLLESGDVLIFGGESRHVFHGVPSIIPNSAPKELLEDTCLLPGRLNFTFRQY